ncbi:MAG: HDOD domain-containing protein [Candidatus Eisenbacteria bacterium]
MSIFDKIRRHAAVAAGDFAAMFKDVEIPALPASAAGLIAEINRPEPDAPRVTQAISASPELSAKVLRTVNSSFYSLRNRVTTVGHAVSLLGLRQVRSIALSHTMMTAVPRPSEDLFDHGAFWTDSLVRALIARSLRRRTNPKDADEAFTTMLLADVAIPVLMSEWTDYYGPLFATWPGSKSRLSALERVKFQWDHSQAGAGVLQAWGFPEEMICFVATHTRTRKEIRELGIEETIALPVAVAALTPSVLQPDPARGALMVSEAKAAFGLDRDGLSDIIDGVRVDLEVMLCLFGLDDRGASAMLEEMVCAEAPAGSEGTP